MAYPKELPERYYLSHFHEFLRFFDGPSRELLGEETTQFIEQFLALDEPKQCLVARAANRKYPLNARSTFNYDEIPAAQQHLDELVAQGWFVPANHADGNAFVQSQTKSALLDLLSAIGVALPASRKKEEVIAHFLEHAPHQQLDEQHPLIQNFVLRTFDDSIQYLLFLYFGHTHGRLNQFSMRDLGIMRTRGEVSSDMARFENAESAQAAYYYANAYEALKSADDASLQGIDLASLPDALCTVSERRKQRYLFQLGSKLLPVDREKALTALKMSGADNAEEKWLREKHKQGDVDEVKAALEAIIDNPQSETLLAFAEDFYARKYGKKRTSVLTDMLRNASRSLQLDESFNQDVERGVVAYYRRHKIEAWRTENQFWRSVFGLLFWDLLFESDEIITEFDRRPQTLRNNDFYQKYEQDIEKRLGFVFAEHEGALRYFTRLAAEKYGQMNSLFVWHQNVLTPIKVLLEQASLTQTAALMRMMSQDYHTLRDGFPDIMVLEQGKLRFEEIKAPGDQLRRNQMLTIQRMQSAGFDVAITQVTWYRDPNQPYVVVDIETTGGQSQSHRITEIGMVKMVAGEVVDEWQSLINPQRHIPQRITQLTGISNAMVADAPTFEQVAEQVDSFTQDCIFVAHNVNFDFGFIKQEFARIGEYYKRPKLCTVREMRKAKPGLKSYSLANLTQHFEIGMEQHHRALSDARAAAELLRISQQLLG